MRTRPIIGRKAWFGPRSLGWGWGPISWEGWAAGAAFLAIVFVGPTVFGDADRNLLGLSATGALLLLCVLKGTSPGGPDRAAEHRRLSQQRRR
jgi:hypothetical protein